MITRPLLPLPVSKSRFHFHLWVDVGQIHRPVCRRKARQGTQGRQLYWFCALFPVSPFRQWSRYCTNHPGAALIYYCPLAWWAVFAAREWRDPAVQCDMTQGLWLVGLHTLCRRCGCSQMIVVTLVKFLAAVRRWDRWRRLCRSSGCSFLWQPEQIET